MLFPSFLRLKLIHFSVHLPGTRALVLPMVARTHSAQEPQTLGLGPKRLLTEQARAPTMPGDLEPQRTPPTTLFPPVPKRPATTSGGLQDDTTLQLLAGILSQLLRLVL
jgi:hypothetical protein